MHIKVKSDLRMSKLKTVVTTETMIFKRHKSPVEYKSGIYKNHASTET